MPRTPNYNAGPADKSRSVDRFGPDVVQMSRAESSRALRDLPAPTREEAEEVDHEVRRTPRHWSPPPVGGDPVLQPHGPISTMPAAILNFKGQGAATTKSTVTGTPPDTNGAVGPKNFVQTVNGGIQVWDKSGTVVMASKLLNTLWTGYTGTNAGNKCATENDGDPVVVYDMLADRWFITQFSLPNSSSNTGPSFQCVALSKTSDPTGAYWLYDFSYPAGINDYGKFSAWPDGYYATFNLFGSSYLEGDLCAYDRVSMLQGLPATQQCFQDANAYGVQPGNLDGKIAPPLGEPGYFAQLDGNNSTTVDLWTLHLDWKTPANTKLTGPTLLPVATYTPTCGGSSGTCVPSAGGTQLDSLDDRLMFRLSYRNYGTHESLLVNHSVLAGAVGGIRWYEIRSPSTTPVIYQQGTYAPADSTWRWMGSLAQDQAQGIVLGYSMSSTAKNPFIGWTGRLAADALGTMTQGESTLDSGGSTESGASRWGDYSNMTVDPADDCTFWYTQELYNTSGTATWDTFVATVKLPSCAANDFSITMTPATENVATGGHAIYTVTTAATAGTAETIALNIQDLPTGVTAAFSPTTVTAGSTSTLTLTATATAPATTTPIPTITVIGTAPSAVHAASAQVAVVNCTAIQACPGGTNCGSIPDGCGGQVPCGPACTAPQTCGGGGTPNVCACPAATTCPAGQTCGTAPDGCGGTVICGSCNAPQTCGGGGTANQCGCTPSVTTCPAGDVCGTVSDGCGGTVSCGGPCAAGQTCQANQCVSGGGEDGGGGVAGDGGSGNGNNGGNSNGCGCRTAGASDAPAPAMFALAGLGLVAAARRRRRR